MRRSCTPGRSRSREHDELANLSAPRSAQLPDASTHLVATGEADTLADVSPPGNDFLCSPGGTLVATGANAQDEGVATPPVTTAEADTLPQGADTPLATRVDGHAELAGAASPVAPWPSPLASRGDVPPTPAGNITPDANNPVCLVCFEEVREGDAGLLTATTYPCCQSTAVHLGCLANLARNLPECPNCRSPFPELGTSPPFRALCMQHGVDPAGTAPEQFNTVRACVQDYTCRTFSRLDAPEPPRPHACHVMCCHRVGMIRDFAGSEPRFVDLPDRSMAWSPVAMYGSCSIEGWRQQWQCLRCSNTVTPAEVGMPEGVRPSCNTCHTLQEWSFDCVLRAGRWTCPACPNSEVIAISDDEAMPELEHDDLSVAAARSAVAARNSNAANVPAAPQPVHRLPPGASSSHAFLDYRAAGPPAAAPGPSNSCIYVPLLLEAAGYLQPQAAEAWRNHVVAGSWWSEAVAALQQPGPVAANRLAARMNEFMLGRNRDVHPAEVEVHLRFAALAASDVGPLPLAVAVRSATSDAMGFYIPRNAQEAILMEFLGQEAALALDRQTDTLRRGPPPAPVSPPAPLAAGLHDSPDNEDGPGAPPAVSTDSVGPRPRATDADSDDSGSGRFSFSCDPDSDAESARARDDDQYRSTARQRRAGRAQPSQAERAFFPDTALLQGAASLDDVDLSSCLRQRVLSLQGVPGFLRGVLRALLRYACRLIRERVHAARGWKLLLLAPRMLLFRERGQSSLPRAEFDRRVALLQAGNWTQLLSEAAATCRRQGPAPARDDSLQPRADRAASLAALGELSAAAQALVSEPLAPGNGTTLAELRDPERRPQQSYRDLPEDLMAFLPEQPLRLSWRRFISNLRGTRRGAAAGPSGATAEHYKIMLDDEESTNFLYAAASALARAEVPQAIIDGLRLGRLVTLRKSNGRIRGLVMGDVFRRITSRTLAQQFAVPLQSACSPFQFALSTRAGTECIPRILRAATELDPRCTILSIDGVGAFDHVSREAMLHGLRNNPALSQALPFVRQFYGSSSTYLWYDDRGVAHEVRQAEGGEQGDPLMPGLFALAQHPALLAAQQSLQEGEAIFAFLDDIYVISAPERTRPLFNVLRTALWDHARISLSLGKTRVWNAAGEEPPDIAELGDGTAPVWTGSWSLPPREQGLLVLGSPLGRPEFVQAALEAKRLEQALLLQRIPHVPDLQSAWLLLAMCACPCTNYLLRVLAPAETADFSAAHDAAVSACLRELLANNDPAAWGHLQARRAHLPLRHGGLGLRSSRRLRFAAYWASWADTLPMIQARVPAVAARLVELLSAPSGAPAIPCTRQAEQASMLLAADGFQPPSWPELAGGLRPAQDAELELGEFLRGWQRVASDHRDLADRDALLESLDASGRALLLSQAGTYAGRVFNLLPTSPEFRFPDSHMRVLLLRRLRMPLPITERQCRCRRFLDPLGDHRAACSIAGVLGPRGHALERATARMCREAGARVSTNVALRDMNLDVLVADDRRIEVVANGLPFWHGAQVAVDTTLISPLTRGGLPHPQADSEPGICLERARRRKIERTYPELLAARRCRLLVLGLEVGGRWSPEAVDFLRRLARAKARSSPTWLRQSLAQAYANRWSALLAAAAQRAFAASLLHFPLSGSANVDGCAPSPSDVLSDARWTFPVPDSRVV